MPENGMMPPPDAAPAPGGPDDVIEPRGLTAPWDAPRPDAKADTTDDASLAWPCRRDPAAAALAAAASAFAPASSSLASAAASTAAAAHSGLSSGQPEPSGAGRPPPPAARAAASAVRSAARADAA